MLNWEKCSRCITNERNISTSLGFGFRGNGCINQYNWHGWKKKKTTKELLGLKELREERDGGRGLHCHH
jgi:hypothetical protein